jgi:hypothetical protein
MAELPSDVINFVRKDFTFTIVSVYVGVFGDVIPSLNMDFCFLTTESMQKVKTSTWGEVRKDYSRTLVFCF